MVNCGSDACVNLLLNSTKTCALELIHPAVALAKELKLPDKDIRIAADMLVRLAGVEPLQFKEEIMERMNELEKEKRMPKKDFHIEDLRLFK
jgi:hypothetical protein